MSDQMKMRRVMRIPGLRSDGQVNDQPIVLVVRDPYTQEEYRNADGSPAVTITLRAIGRDERDAIVEANTVIEKGANGRPYERVDSEAVNDEIYRRAIQSWQGIVAADDRPLACTEQTKVLLPEIVKLQISRALFGVESADVADASFREPAGVSGVVGG